MRRIKRMILGATLVLMASCGGPKKGTSYIGKLCEDGLMTLDSDTFRVMQNVGSELFILSEYPDNNDHEYLVRKAKNGYYYVELEAKDISFIRNTSEFVSVSGKGAYNINQKKMLPLPLQSYYLEYLGQWKDLYAFCNGDTICFSDGKILALSENAFCQLKANGEGIKLVNVARSITVSLEELYKAKTQHVEMAKKIEKVEKSYYLQTDHVREDTEMEIGFDLDIEVPQSGSQADVAIREWMLEAIMKDVFSVLGYQDELDAVKKPSFQKMMTCLDSYGTLWEKLYRSEFATDMDSLYFPLNCQIQTRMIADTPSYVTYYYYADPYEGGLHSMPRSYYITYDKHRQTMLSADNTIKPERKKQFVQEVLSELKRMYEETYEDNSSMEEYIEYVQSFQMINSMNEVDDDILKALLVHDYECDRWSGWETSFVEEFSLDNIPLPHLALLPESIVVSYHPYQIDSFAAGEYHAVIPYSKVASALLGELKEEPDLFPKLEDFIHSR